MVGPVVDLNVKVLEGPRWDLALHLLQTGEGAVGIGELVLTADPATEKAGRRLHIQFPCPFDPSQVGKLSNDQLRSLGIRDLELARETVSSACVVDPRLAALVADSGVVYEFVHQYGMGGLLVATAGRTGDLSWR